MSDSNIIKMETIGKEHEGQLVTVVGIISHKKQLEDGTWSAWLQDGVAVELRFTDEVYQRNASDLLAAAVLVPGHGELGEDRTRVRVPAVQDPGRVDPGRASCSAS